MRPLLILTLMLLPVGEASAQFSGPRDDRWRIFAGFIPGSIVGNENLPYFDAQYRSSPEKSGFGWETGITFVFPYGSVGYEHRWERTFGQADAGLALIYLGETRGVQPFLNLAYGWRSTKGPGWSYEIMGGLTVLGRDALPFISVGLVFR